MAVRSGRIHAAGLHDRMNAVTTNILNYSDSISRSHEKRVIPGLATSGVGRLPHS